MREIVRTIFVFVRDIDFSSSESLIDIRDSEEKASIQIVSTP
jgi:hypothetical protein